MEAKPGFAVPVADNQDTPIGTAANGPKPGGCSHTAGAGGGKRLLSCYQT